MLLNVRNDNFRPDETRSGRFVSETNAVTVEESECEHVDESVDKSWEVMGEDSGLLETIAIREGELERMPILDAELDKGDLGVEPDKLESLSDSSDDSSSSTSSANEERLEQKFASSVTLDYTGPLCQHKKSRVLHKPNKTDGLLLCGRRIGTGYNFLQQGASFKWARCSLCFKGEVASNVDELVEAFDNARRKKE